MALKRTVDPTELPVTLGEIKAHLNETDAAKDPEVTTYMFSVVDQLDGPMGILNRALCTQTLELTLNGFPRVIVLPLSPLISVTSVQYIDSNGATQTFSSANYRVLNAAIPTEKGRIELAYGEVWPTVRNIEQNVTVTYQAGFGARNAVPDHIRSLIKVMVKEMYDGREPLIEGGLMRNPAFQGLLWQATFPAVA